MIDPTLLALGIAFAFLFSGLGTWRRQEIFLIVAAVIFIALGLITAGQGIGLTTFVNVSQVDAAGVLIQWSNSTTTYQADPSSSFAIGFSVMLSGLFIILSVAARERD